MIEPARPVRLASLPMYDVPEIRAATDAWWAGIARHMRRLGITGVPGTLRRDANPMAQWRNRDLLFSQTCGYPLTHALAGHVQVVATPVYIAAGTDGPRYASVLITSSASTASALAAFRGAVCAINGTDSHSGCNILRYMIAPIAGGQPFFARVIETGSHVRSLQAVAEGKADLCAVDCVTHALLARHVSRLLEGTRVLGFSPSSPGLPFITGARTPRQDLERMREALAQAVADPALASARKALLIGNVTVLADHAYEEIRTMEIASRQAGYPELA